MGRFSTALSALICFAAIPALAEESATLGDEVKSLLRTETRALNSLSTAKVSALAKPKPAPAYRGKVPAGFEYSRAFLDSRPKPRGGAEWKCLSEALYFEARGETVKGQFAVAEVILNRVDSKLFPNTICGVINQGTGRKFACQFTYTCDGRAEHINEPRAYARVGKVARLMIDNKAPRSLTGGATYYHTKAVRPSWSRVFTRTATIGVHHFYRKGG